MAQSTDTEIRELKDLILGLDRKIDALDTKIEVYTARTFDNAVNMDYVHNSLICIKTHAPRRDSIP